MSKQQLYDKVDLLGVSVDVIGLAQAIGHICSYAGDRAKPAGYVVKPYVEFLDKANSNPELISLLNEAELSIADGVAVLWAAHYLYAGPRTLLRLLTTLTQIVTAPDELSWPVPERAAGISFTWPLLRAAAAKNIRVYLIGKESPAEIELVATTIIREIPNIVIAGTSSGRDTSSPHGAVSQSWIAQTAGLLSGANAELVLVGMGFPLQEQVCAQLAGRMKHGLLVGEGGTFDYDSFGGRRRKAPQVVQRSGLEWLWRLTLEPHRIIRQLAIPRFIYRIWRTR
jgi:N-acetylglucosaminyldiphosphoundecaprenol N-acetyl-beta-D-mannosaminyltransferase